MPHHLFLHNSTQLFVSSNPRSPVISLMNSPGYSCQKNMDIFVTNNRVICIPKEIHCAVWCHSQAPSVFSRMWCYFSCLSQDLSRSTHTAFGYWASQVPYNLEQPLYSAFPYPHFLCYFLIEKPRSYRKSHILNLPVFVSLWHYFMDLPISSVYSKLEVTSEFKRKVVVKNISLHHIRKHTRSGCTILTMRIWSRVSDGDSLISPF